MPYRLAAPKAMQARLVHGQFLAYLMYRQSALVRVKIDFFLWLGTKPVFLFVMLENNFSHTVILLVI